MASPEVARSAVFSCQSPVRSIGSSTGTREGNELGEPRTAINSFTGETPLDFANLKQLKLLNLFTNKLHGSIPEFISDILRLEILRKDPPPENRDDCILL